MSSANCVKGAALLMLCAVCAFLIWACSTQYASPYAFAVQGDSTMPPGGHGAGEERPALQRVPLPPPPEPSRGSDEFQRMQGRLGLRSDMISALVGSVFGDKLSPEAAEGFIPLLERLAEREDPAIAKRAKEGLRKLGRR